ncbi:unnamed protein product [Linum tenue]|uniref:Uncharacterized protein n=1 Tax=Linum tenue TaxID=586396 RepID=A0AAV0KM42_9ROSI|nr:unnamed protein product [Linum tenue]
MGHELRARGMSIVLSTAHLHHPAPFSAKNVQELLTFTDPVLAVPNSHLIIHKRQPGPRMLPTLGSKHWVRAQDIEFHGQILQHYGLGEFFHGEHIDEKGIAFQSLKGERLEYLLGGEDGCAEQYDFRVALAEVVRVGVEADAEGGGGGGVVGARVGDDGVALAGECFGEELAVIAESEDGDF